MSSYSDLYLYAPDDETGVEKFNTKLIPIQRVYPLKDTEDGYDLEPLHMNYKYACRLRSDDVQEALNAVRWRSPDQVVAIVLSWDYAELTGTEVFRPYFIAGPAFQGERRITQVDYAVDPRRDAWAEGYEAGLHDGHPSYIYKTGRPNPYDSSQKDTR